MPAIHQLETRACATMFMYNLAWPLFGWKLRSGLMGEDETRRGMRDRRKFSGKFSWVRKIDSNALSLRVDNLFLLYIF